METGLGSRASVRHPLWTFTSPRLRPTWAGAFESWPDLFSRGKGQVPPAHPREFWDLRFTHVCLVHPGLTPHTAEP